MTENAESKELVAFGDMAPKKIFKPGGANPVIAKVEEWAKSLVPDVSKRKGRDEIRSNAANVRKFKVKLEDAKMLLKKEYKDLLDPIDAESRLLRASLDKISDEVRKPLTDWEEADKLRKANEKAASDYAQAFDDATAENDILNRERDLKRREDEMEREKTEEAYRVQQVTEAALAKEKAAAEALAAEEERARVAKETEEREERLKAEAAAKVERELKDKAGNARVEMLSAIDVELDFNACREMDDSTWTEFYGQKNDVYQTRQKELWVEEQRAKVEKEKADAEKAAETERLRVKFLADFDQATAMNATVDLEREKVRRENERLVEEERAKNEAEEAARQAERNRAAAHEAADRAERERIEAAEKSEQGRVDAEQRAKREAEETTRVAEERRLADIERMKARAAQESARVEAENNKELARLEKIEQDRIAEENRKLAEQKRRDDDKAHLAQVNSQIVSKVMWFTGCDKEKGQELVKAIIKGEVDNVKITY